MMRLLNTLPLKRTGQGGVLEGVISSWLQLCACLVPQLDNHQILEVEQKNSSVTFLWQRINYSSRFYCNLLLTDCHLHVSSVVRGTGHQCETGFTLSDGSFWKDTFAANCRSKYIAYLWKSLERESSSVLPVAISHSTPSFKLRLPLDLWPVFFHQCCWPVAKFILLVDIFQSNPKSLLWLIKVVTICWVARK